MKRTSVKENQVKQHQARHDDGSPELQRVVQLRDRPTPNGDEVHLQKLLIRTGHGDRAAFAELYDLTSAKLLGITLRILKERTLAEDALQEAYVRMWSTAARFAPELASPLGWMTTVVRNQAIDVRRRSARHLAAIAVDTAELDELLAALSSSNASGEQERNDSFDRALQCLSELGGEAREMVMLAYHQGWSREELAKHFSRPVATIKTQLRRSLQNLKACIEGQS
jgi:RNA polymerase sigma-70 factor (ECF subfamily)